MAKLAITTPGSKTATSGSGSFGQGDGDDPLLDELLALATQADHGETSEPLGELSREERRKVLFGG